MTIKIMSPIGVPATLDRPYTLSIDASDFTGTIGVLANSQPGSIDFVKALGQALEPLLPGAVMVYGDKGLSPAGSSMVMDAQELAEVVQHHDAVILAYGHCGGCTSATLRDAVAIAGNGRPVVALVVPRFLEQAVLVARASGMSGVPVHVLPGPMTQLSAEGRAEAARSVAPAVVGLLVRRPA